MYDWWLDETKCAGAEHLDPVYVSRYDQKASYDPVEDVAALCKHGLAEGKTLIDFGSGTGTFAFAAAKEGARVVAVDCSPPMVEAMRARVERERIEAVEIVQAGVLTYEQGAEKADFAFSRNALHHLPDFWKGIALHRMRSCLRDGGILLLRDLVFDFGPSESGDAIAQWMAGAASDPRRGYTARELAEHVRTEFSTYSWLMEPLIEKGGFRILTRDYERRVYARYECRAV
jgi:cyclopropane fatty-acyl-phospholipid synthase-like methyltransferase